MRCRTSGLALAMLTGWVVGAVALAADPVKMETARGQVTAVDLQTRTVTLKTETGAVEAFKLNEKAEIAGPAGKPIALKDLLVGERITVSYSGTGPTRMATRLAVVSADAKKPA